MKIDTKTLTIHKASELLRKGDFSSVELCEACISVIEEKNQELNAVLEVFSDWKEQAQEADKRIKAGEKNQLCGIPIIIKDNILFEGHHASAGSKMLETYIASYSATAIERLRAAGAVILGRGNMDDAAMGSSTESSYYGPTKNPYDTTRVPGGSSGGSAVSVASGMCLGALGTDTGGSVRQPAGFCGVAGFKSSYGYTSRYGIVALGNSLDQVGPIGKTAQDIKLIQDVIGGFDEKDATSVKLQTSSKVTKVIGVPWKEIEQEGISKETLENFKNTISKLEKSGYNIKDISLPTMKYSLAVYYIVMPAEVSTNLSRLDGMRYGYSASGEDLMETYMKSREEGFGREVRRRIILGTYVLSHGYYDAYYRKALLVRDAIKKEFEKLFKEVDIIATPTSPTTAFKLGEKSKDPLAMYLADIFTVPADIAGLPAISVPNGFDSQGLPFDIQFEGPFGADSSVIDFAVTFESIRDK